MTPQCTFQLKLGGEVNPMKLLNVWVTHIIGSRIWLVAWSYPNRFEEVQVGEEVALGFVQPITGRIADDFLRQTGDVAVSNMDKVFQGCGITEVSKMEAETFSQHLDREKKKTAVQLK